MMRKSVTLAIPAVPAAGNSGRVAIATPDDSVVRHIVGVKSSLTTKGMTFTFDLNTSPVVVVDAAVLGQLTQVMQVQYDIPSTIQVSFSLANTTGGALAAGDFVTVVYEV